jgi:hypothetical protein
VSYFKWNERLQVYLPHLDNHEYVSLPAEAQATILAEWQQRVAKFPDEVLRLEALIEARLTAIQDEEEWDIITEHFNHITEYASRIHELNLWQRIDPTLSRCTSTNVADTF